MIDHYSFSEHLAIRQPRRLSLYVLIWCNRGSVTVVVDEKELVLKRHEVLTITSGQIHYFKKTDKAEGVILEFPLAFFCKDDHDVELIFHNGLFCHFAQNEVIAVGQHEVMEEQLRLIGEELEQEPYQYLLSIHSRIKLLLIAINRAKVERGDEIWKPDALFLKFLELVRANFEHNYSLARLAGMLGTTEAKLNE
ncbi:MAG: AraC family transcriptional regulator, partial [Chitinophaga rupis]